MKLNKYLKLENFIFLLIVGTFSLICLFLYLFYRPEYTIVKHLWSFVFDLQHQVEYMQSIFHIPIGIVNSLPEGIWICVLTIISYKLHVNIFKRINISISIVPISLALIIELFQLLHITDGYFDYKDILFSVVGWLLGLVLSKYLFKSFYYKEFPLWFRYVCFFLFVFAIYLSDVYVIGN